LLALLQIFPIKTLANPKYKMEGTQGMNLTHVHSDHIQAATRIFQRCTPG
jgi:hypothetical protein